MLNIKFRERVMKNRIIRTTLCILMTGALITINGCSMFLEDNHERPEDYKPYYESTVGAEQSLSELPRDSFRMEEYDKLLAKFKKLLEEPGNEEELLLTYDELVLAYDSFSSDYGLIQYDFYLNPQNEELGDKVEEYATTDVSIQDDTFTAFREVFDTDYADAFTEYLDEDVAEAYAAYESLTEEQEKLANEVQALVLEYDSMINEEDQSEEWTQRAKQLYVDLVNKNTALAKASGYDSYVEYAYDAVYGRDYTYEDIQNTESIVAEKVLPVLLAYTDLCVTDGDIEAAYEENTDSGETKYENLIDGVYEINQELGETMDHLFEVGLVDIDSSEEKMSIGYTMSLPYYMDAYVFDCPYDMYYDYQTVIHEFGHYNNMYHNYYPGLLEPSNVDVSEIHSQGLEVLYVDHYEDAVGGYGEALKESTLYNLMSAVINGYAVNEMEYLAYTTEDLTVEKLDAIVDDVNAKYLTSEDILSDYINISHIYESPFYYIGYATSALAALELYQMSQEDWDQAVDTYMNITNSSLYTPFLETLENIGMQDALDSQVQQKLFDELAEDLDVAEDLDWYIEYVQQQ